MNRFSELLKRYSLIIGILLMFLLTWLIELANSGVLPLRVSFLVAYLVGYGIVFATLIVTGLTLGKHGVIALLKRFLIWRVGWKWYLVPFLLVPSIYLLILFLNAWISQTPVDFSTVFVHSILGPNANLGLLVIPFLISDAITNGEEIGWRGLFVPELAKTTNFTKTALISGVVWAAWHMPGIFLADLNDTGIPNLYAATMFAVLIISISFPFAWLTLKSGSLWPAVLLHAFHNQLIMGILDKFTGKTEITPYITEEYGIGMALTGLVVAYVFWRMRPDISLSPSKVSTASASQ